MWRFGKGSKALPNPRSGDALLPAPDRKLPSQPVRVNLPNQLFPNQRQTTMGDANKLNQAKRLPPPSKSLPPRPSQSRSLPPAPQTPVPHRSLPSPTSLAPLPRPSARSRPKPNPTYNLQQRPRRQPPRPPAPAQRVQVSVLPPRSFSELALLYGTRLLILGVGIGVIAGTFLSIWNPAQQVSADSSPTVSASPIAPSPAPSPLTLELAQEALPLKAQIQSAIAPLSQLVPGFMVVDMDSYAHVEVNSTNVFPAASTIKFPVLVAFFQAVDAGKIRLDEMLTMRQDLVAAESGDMQYQAVGTQFSTLDVATKMITISDNTATNMLIDRLGGKDTLNQRFQSWGMVSTGIRNLLPDLNGTNTSSPRDMVTLLSLISRGQLISVRSHERMIDIMRRVETNTLLPPGLGKGATIAHKTGDIGGMVGDVGVIDMPTGKRYLMAAMVRRPHNDDQAKELIRQVSQMTYQYFSQATRRPYAATSQPITSPIASPIVSPIASPIASPTVSPRSFAIPTTPEESATPESVNPPDR